MYLSTDQQITSLVRERAKPSVTEHSSQTHLTDQIAEMQMDANAGDAQMAEAHRLLIDPAKSLKVQRAPCGHTNCSPKMLP